MAGYPGHDRKEHEKVNERITEDRGAYRAASASSPTRTRSCSPRRAHALRQEVPERVDGGVDLGALLALGYVDYCNHYCSRYEYLGNLAGT